MELRQPPEMTAFPSISCGKVDVVNRVYVAIKRIAGLGKKQRTTTLECIEEELEIILTGLISLQKIAG